MRPWFAYLTFATFALATTPLPGQTLSDLTFRELTDLAQRRDYFRLRERVVTAGNSIPALVGQAIVNHAFNHAAASNAAIERLLIMPALPDSIRDALRLIAIDNALRLFQYGAGLEMADAMLAGGTQLDSASIADVRNSRRILFALRHEPPQSVTVRGDSRIQMASGFVPVTINGSPRNYAFDTGANLSTIMRSEALALGLEIFSAGIDVGSSTDRRVTGDIGVADSILIGAIQVQHVVFLVLDDSLLTFPGNYRIPGIIGFPVIEAMQEVRIVGRTQIVVPRSPPHRTQSNLALDGMTLLSSVRLGNDHLTCRLDTGAGLTQLYEPYYQRAKAYVDAATTATTRQMGGVGGIRDVRVRALPNVVFAIGDTAVSLKSVDVVLDVLTANPRDNYLDCNVGHDIFDQFGEVVLNFRDMAFVLR